MTEIWKPIHDGLYAVSDKGRVRREFVPNGRTKSGKIIQPWGMYPTIALRIDGKTIKARIHVLVAIAFVGPSPGPQYEVNHIDGNKRNCVPANLEWVTRSENLKHAYRTGLRKMSEDHPWRKQGMA